MNKIPLKSIALPPWSVLLAGAVLTAVPRAAGTTHTWDFDLTAAPPEWTFEAVDLPADWETDPLQPDYQLVGEERALPPLLGTGTTWYLEGSNYSDSLFLYLYRRIEGLEASTVYNLDFAVEFASDENQATFGIGGGPGSSVWIKAGAGPEEPARVVRDGYYHTPMDVGNQSGDGGQGGVVGLYGYTEDPAEGEWKWLRRELGEKRFSARSDSGGGLWLLVGMESGFEGTSSVFLARFEGSATSGVWAEADTVLETGWIEVPWIGWLYAQDLRGGWDYHLELGWLYVPAGDPGALWMYADAFGWCYTGPEIFPWVHLARDEPGWMRFERREGDRLEFTLLNGAPYTIELD
jgi:hypothetical protein